MNTKIAAVIQAAYLKWQGKTGLATTDPKYTQLLNLCAYYTQEWQDTTNVDWMSLWFVSNLGAIAQSASSAGLQSTASSVPLDPTMRKLSQRENDSVILLGIDGLTTWNYNIVRPDQFNEKAGKMSAAPIQGNLVFCTPLLVNDARIGAQVFCPGFGFVTPITKDTQICQVDDPTWLEVRVAAEAARTDLVRQNQYPLLLAESNDKLQAMKDNNSNQIDEIPIDMELTTLDPNMDAGAWV